jgi:hypothetical protein
MPRCKAKKKIPFPSWLTDAEALVEGKWVPATPETVPEAVAFSGVKATAKCKGFPFAVFTECTCDRPDCPHDMAMQRTCDRYSAANGAAWDAWETS